jgi:hypothetical protein
MDVDNEDLLRFWKYLYEYKVRYIMVGGFATRFHGYNRTTDDIDMWLEDTLANRQNLRAAFKGLGYGDFPSLEKMQFVPGWTNFYVGDGIVLDIMTNMKGLEEFTFEQCFTEASIAEIDDVEIPFLHINQLILNKKAVYRPKDKVDVQELEKIKKLREEER